MGCSARWPRLHHAPGSDPKDWPDGKEVKEWKGPGTKETSEALAVHGPSQTVFVAGWNSQSNLWWPWLVAYDFEGNKKWERYNWTKKDAWAGGTADSLIKHMKVVGDKLYVAGTSDGNPTTFEKDPTNVRSPLPESTKKINMISRADPNSSRPVAWIGVFDANSGDILSQGRLFAQIIAARPNGKIKGSAGATDIVAMNEGPDGSILIGGYVRGKIAWTEGSPNTSSGAVTWRGKWRNPEAPRDPFFIKIDPNTHKASTVWSFSQGDTDLYDGTIKDIAVGPEGHIALVGVVHKPGTPLTEKQAQRNAKRPQFAKGPQNIITLKKAKTFPSRQPFSQKIPGKVNGVGRPTATWCS